VEITTSIISGLNGEFPFLEYLVIEPRLGIHFSLGFQEDFDHHVYDTSFYPSLPFQGNHSLSSLTYLQQP